MRKRVYRASNLLVVLSLIALIVAFAPGAAAVELVWEFDYSYIHLEWDGTWDDMDYWAYGSAVLDIPDWGYLWALYGLGWDKMWATGVLQGGDGTVGAVDKVHMHFYSADDGLYGYTPIGSKDFYINTFYRGTLNITGDWVTQVCTLGRTAAHETSHIMYNIYLGNPPSTYEHLFLTEALAWYVGNVLWPWGDEGETFSSIQSQYQSWMNNGGYIYTTWAEAAYNYYGGAVTDGEFYRAIYTFQAAGWLFSDFYYLDGSGTGDSSVYLVTDLLTFLRFNANQFSEAFNYAYGHPALMSGLTHWNLDPDSNDLNAWLFYLMWGYWYQAS